MKPLTKNSFKTKQKVVEKLVNEYSEHEKLLIVLNAMFCKYKIKGREKNTPLSS
jgi:hypothetical protein